MKRLHLHVSVPDLSQSIQFYETLFGAKPSVVHDDYAKWMLDDPKVNFAISQRGRPAGLDHVGIQVDSTAELSELAGRLKAAGAATYDEQAVTCCYAKGDKTWTADPAGLRWETFHTFGEAVTYGESDALRAMATAQAAAPAAAACGCPAAVLEERKPEPVVAAGCGTGTCA